MEKRGAGTITEGFHRCGIESLWRCHAKQRASDAGPRRPLRHDQQDARHVPGANCRCAQKVVEATVDTCFAPNKTIQELHKLIKNGAGIDPLKDFSEAAREELRAFTSP
jgi:hypothetical protein